MRDRPFATSKWLALQWQLLRPYGRCLYYKLFPGRRPAYFHDTWKYPTSRVDSPVPALPQLPQSDRLTFFFFPMTDWHARTQRSQQLAKALVDLGVQCIYVNPHLGLEYLKPYLADRHSKLSYLEPGIFELHVHLPREHAFYERPLTPGESALVADEVVGLAKRFGIKGGIAVISLPIWLQVAEDVRTRLGAQILYDCHDWLPGFCRIPSEVQSLEATLLETADITMFSSQRLFDLIATRSTSGKQRSIVVRNGVDPRHFGISHSARTGSRVPTVGYVGALDSWFDIGVIERSAQDHPNWKFILVGAVEDEKIDRLRTLANVEFAGEVPHETVPQYLATWDVAVIPFLLNDLTLAANPIKLYEYFALGLPVVSTRLPEVELYGHLAYVADSAAGFSQMIELAMNERDEKLREQRIALSCRETWCARATELLEAAAPEIVALPKRSG